MSRSEAPLYVDALRAAQWVVENTDPSSMVGRRLQESTLDLCELVATALGSEGPAEALPAADEALVRIRVVLRLALDLGHVSDGGFLHLCRELDGIGRQIGEWRRRLARARGQE